MKYFDKYLTSGKGLSSTSANYIANVGKEYVAEFEAKLNNLKFYSTHMELLSNPTNVTTNKGLNDKDVEEFAGTLHRIAGIKAFCAWLREAIKTKENMLRNISSMSCTEYIRTVLNQNPDDYNTFASSVEPAANDRTIDEQSKYLTVEAFAAVFGKFIHKGGAFHTARTKLHDIINNPNDIEGDGQDRIIVNYRPTVSSDTVESNYMKLQKIWRSYEAQLNEIKYKTEQEDQRRYMEVQNEKARIAAAYKEILGQFEKWQAEERQRIGNLKILVPAIFEDTYQFLESLGTNE